MMVKTLRRQPLRATNHELLATIFPPIPPNQGFLISVCIPSFHQVSRFGISDSRGFARRKAPSFIIHYVYITITGGPP